MCEYSISDSLRIEARYKAFKKFVDPSFIVIIKDEFGLEVARFSTMPISGFEIRDLHEVGCVSLTLKNLPLVSGKYFLDFGFARTHVEWFFNLERIIELRVHERDVYESGMLMDRTRGLIIVDHVWDHSAL